MKKRLGQGYHSLLRRHAGLRPLQWIFGNRRRQSIVLPAADAFLREQDVQWWYWTGHLQTENGRRFGFEIVFFAFNSWIFFKNQLAQAALTDVQNDSFHYREEVEFCSLPHRLPGRFELRAFELGETVIQARGGGGRDRLQCKLGDYELDLELAQETAPVFHYGGGAHDYRFGGYTYYYARERMKTTGTLRIGGEVHAVSGNSWFDRQYGDLYEAIFKGWQWFALTLNDGRSIMLYDFLKEQRAERMGSISVGNDSRSLDKDDFSVNVLKSWRCPASGILFPAAWEVCVDAEIFRVTPQVTDQTLIGRHGFWIGPEYWEGTCVVTASDETECGMAYVELNGFGHKLISLDLAGAQVDFGI